MEPSQKHLAEFALLGLRYRILTPASVVAWADSIIADSDVPAEWVIDLAMATPRTIESELKLVPGDVQIDLSVHLFLALVFRRWRAGELTIGAVCSIAKSLSRQFESRIPQQVKAWGWSVYFESDNFDNGLVPLEDLRAFIDRKLQEYCDFEWMLPAWTERCGSQSVAEKNQFCFSQTASNRNTSAKETDKLLLPREEDFDPTGEDLDAHWAWVNFVGLTIQEAQKKLSDRTDIYPEAFGAMGGRAFAFYFPAIDDHLRKVPEENVNGDDYASSYLAHCIKHQLESDDYLFVLHLIPQMIALAQYVRQNISRFGYDMDEQRQIEHAWIELENRVSIMSESYRPG